MNMMEIFFILWFYVLPVVGILALIFVPIIWFFVVPNVSRRLTWARFRNVDIHAIADDSGYLELCPSQEKLPEGLVRTKRGWRFLPRPIPPGKKGELYPAVQKLTLKPYILKGLGKPIWFDYAGKITSLNPATLAGLQQKENTVDIEGRFTYIEKLVEDLPKNPRKELKAKLKELKVATEAKPITNIDINKIKQVVSKLHPPSVWKAFGINRELRGMKRRGSELMWLILGGAIIIGVTVIGVVAVLSL